MKFGLKINSEVVIVCGGFSVGLVFVAQELVDSSTNCYNF